MTVLGLWCLVSRGERQSKYATFPVGRPVSLAAFTETEKAEREYRAERQLLHRFARRHGTDGARMIADLADRAETTTARRHQYVSRRHLLEWAEAKYARGEVLV